MLSGKLSITMDVLFCLEALDEALAEYGKPEIFNTDQVSQFASVAFTDRLKHRKVSRSAWMARDAGRTMSSLSASDVPSNMKRSISMLTNRSQQHGAASDVTSSSSTRSDPIPA